MKVCFGIALICLLGLAGCDTPTHAHAVYRTPPVCTDMKPLEPLDKPPDEQPQPACVASNPGGEMFDRERGVVGVPQGIGIIVTEVFYGVTGAR